MQQVVETALRHLGRLPPNLDLAHHNSIAGRDEWKDLVLAVVVGRTMPNPAAMIPGTPSTRSPGSLHGV